MESDSPLPKVGQGTPLGGLVKLLDLAKGGMGRVELALRREGEFRRVYAVKRLHPHLVEDADLRAMFIDEARVAGRIRHANVVSVLDVGEDREGPYLVMDYVEGLALSAIMAHHAASGELLPVQICVRIGAEIARGLQAAHELTDDRGELLQVVHRDVSPSNVLVGFDGGVRLADFGIARALGRSSELTGTGIIKGKLGYQAPEQLRFEKAEVRSDLFALGIVLYELLAGRRLYKESDESSGPLRILNDPPPDIGDERNDVPPELTELLFELLAKNREDRPASARIVARRLDEIAATIGREEEPIGLADYMERIFAEPRAERARALGEALARAETEATVALIESPRIDDATAITAIVSPSVRSGAAHASKSSRRALTVLSVVALLAAMLTGAFVWSRAKAESVSPGENADSKSAPPAPTGSTSVGASNEPLHAPPARADATIHPETTEASARVVNGPHPPGATSGTRKPKTGIPTWGWK